MSEDHSYGISQIVGSSTTSIDDAIRTAIDKAREDRRHIRWFEVEKISGHVADQQVQHFQVELKLGYTIEE